MNRPMIGLLKVLGVSAIAGFGATGVIVVGALGAMPVNVAFGIAVVIFIVGVVVAARMVRREVLGPIHSSGRAELEEDQG